MHAGRIALDLGIPSLLIPWTPGVTSALGLLMSDVKHDYVRSKLVSLGKLDLDEINGLFAQLTAQANSDLHSEGFDDSEIVLHPFLDLRYAGQGYELTVPSPMPPLNRPTWISCGIDSTTSTSRPMATKRSQSRWSWSV